MTQGEFVFTSIAYAQENDSVGTDMVAPSGFTSLLPLLLMLGLFYFLLIRPQQKKIGDHKRMIAALRRGDKILTVGGVYGTVTKVEDELLHVEIAPDVKVKLARSSVGSVLTRSEPAEITDTKA